jgi:hypothetical protein
MRSRVIAAGRAAELVLREGLTFSEKKLVRRKCRCARNRKSAVKLVAARSGDDASSRQRCRHTLPAPARRFEFGDRVDRQLQRIPAVHAVTFCAPSTSIVLPGACR